MVGGCSVGWFVHLQWDGTAIVEVVYGYTTGSSSVGACKRTIEVLGKTNVCSIDGSRSQNTGDCIVIGCGVVSNDSRVYDERQECELVLRGVVFKQSGRIVITD